MDPQGFQQLHELVSQILMQEVDVGGLRLQEGKAWKQREHILQGMLSK